MASSRNSTASLLVVACFSRHVDALAWAEQHLQLTYGPILLRSADFDFHHTHYYEPAMGPGLRKRLILFEPTVAPDCLPDVKRHTIGLEHALAESGQFAEARPLNLDPGLLQLGKFLLATTKDQSHRIYLRDGIFAECTLRYHAGAFEPWPWTYADYREAEVLRFLCEARDVLHGRVREVWVANPQAADAAGVKDCVASPFLPSINVGCAPAVPFWNVLATLLQSPGAADTIYNRPALY